MFDEIAKCQTLFQHPNFSAFFDCVSTTSATFGAIHQTLNNYYNDSQHTKEGLERFEETLVDSVREFYGLPDNFSSENGGLCTFQPTTGNSSLMAVNLAKKIAVLREQEKNPSLSKKEIISRLVGYLPVTSHSHCIKSLSLCDIKYNRNIQSKYIKELNTFQMDLEELEEQIADDKSKGLIPFFIMGVLGATATGCNDDLRSLSVISKKNDCFFMIDGAWAGTFLSDSKVRENLKLEMENFAAQNNYKYGKIEKGWYFQDVDCFVINKSKVGLTGMDGTVCFVSNSTQTRPEINGFFNSIPEEDELGKLSHSQMTRLSDNQKSGLLKAHYVLQSYGKEGYVRHTQKSFESAIRMEQFLKTDPRFELVPKRNYALTLFRLKGESDDHSRELTQKLMKKMDLCDKLFFVAGDVDGIYFIRYSTSSITHPRHVDEVWGLIKGFTDELYEELGL